MKELAADGKVFDLVFVDANKSEYSTYVDILLDSGLVAQGSLIVVDNVHFKGTAWCNNGISDHMKTSRFVRSFNDKIAQDSRLNQVMLPIRDGVTLIEVTGLDTLSNLQQRLCSLEFVERSRHARYGQCEHQSSYSIQ